MKSRKKNTESKSGTAESDEQYVIIYYHHIPLKFRLSNLPIIKIELTEKSKQEQLALKKWAETQEKGELFSKYMGSRFPGYHNPYWGDR